MTSVKTIAAALLVTAALPLSAAPVAVDAKIAAYAPVSGVSGNLNSIGSDTLNNLMTLWAEGFKAQYPNVNIQIQGKGSATAPPALIEGAAQLAPMSRPMKSTEIDAFEKKFGYKPTEIKVAIDALAVFTHKDNPVASLSMTQVDGIFSSTRKRGGFDIGNWGEVGLDSDWASKPISLYGRNSASGTYGFFKEHTLDKGDFKSSVKEQPGSSAVITGVAGDLGGIGYSGIGYVTPGVKALPLSAKPGAKAYAPNYENCLSGDYPLSRYLLVYVNRKPGTPMDPLTKEFIKFVVSQQGQQVVVKDHYFPLPKEDADAIKKLVE